MTKKLRRKLNKIGVFSYPGMFLNFIISANPLFWWVGMAIALAFLTLLLIGSGGEVVEIGVKPVA